LKSSVIFRVLTTPIDDLRGTDITEAALEKLSKSRIKRVSILGKVFINGKVIQSLKIAIVFELIEYYANGYF
jgi:hypothetical protein